MSTKQRGRPPLYDAPVTAMVKLYVTPAQRLELRRIASDSRAGVSSVIREAINCYVADYGARRPFPRR